MRNLRGLSEDKLADGIDRYLEKYNRDNEPEYTLRTEMDAPYLYRGIFKDPPDRDLEPYTARKKRRYTRWEKSVHEAMRPGAVLIAGLRWRQAIFVALRLPGSVARSLEKPREEEQ